MPLIAATTGMSWRRFLAWTLLGSLPYALGHVALGYLLADAIGRASGMGSRVAVLALMLPLPPISGLTLTLLGALLAYLVFAWLDVTLDFTWGGVLTRSGITGQGQLTPRETRARTGRAAAS